MKPRLDAVRAARREAVIESARKAALRAERRLRMTQQLRRLG